MEFFVDELTDKRNLTTLVNAYLAGAVSANVVMGIVNFYLEVQSKCKKELTDGVGNKPHFRCLGCCVCCVSVVCCLRIFVCVVVCVVCVLCVLRGILCCVVWGFCSLNGR